MDRPITGGKWGVVHEFNVMADQRGVATAGSYSTNTDGGAHVIENMENARFIALAGTVANQLFDAGLDGIEAVKALPELIQQLKSLKDILGKQRSTSPHGKIIAELCETDMLLARLKGDAE